MSQKSTISISFKLEGDDSGFQKLAVDAEGLRKVMHAAVVEAEKLKSSVINFAALSTGIDSLSRTLSDIQNVFKNLEGAYAAQVEAETKLAVNMRNAMSAREEDIQSIKDLCSAQQDLGVIGDEVQLAGAQELAVHLKEKESLEQLIPAMNDLIAKQYGLNASQENAAQIASMLGKVMDGQTGAMKRYGYTFTSAQEQILKYGTEAERVSVLCEVVSSKVGGMNAELAKTPAGKLKQTENTLGDMKEQLGALANSIAPYLTMAAQLTTSIGGLIKLTAGLKLMTLSLFKIGKTTFLGIGAAAVKGAKYVKVFSVAITHCTTSAKALTVALRGLLISSVIGGAIFGLVSVVSHLVSTTDEATESTLKLLSAEEQAKRNIEEMERLGEEENTTRVNTNAALMININRLKDFNGTKEQEKKLVSEMNDIYGDSMGYFSSVADWYKALISNSEAYCRQMVIEARTRNLANLIAQKEQTRDDLQADIDSGKLSTERKKKLVKSGKIVTSVSGYAVPDYETKVMPSELEQAQQRIEDINSEIAALNNQFENVTAELKDIKLPEIGSSVRPDLNTHSSKSIAEKEKTRYQQLGDLIEQSKEKYISASENEREEIRKNIGEWTAERRAIELLQKEAERPISLNSFEDIDAEIAYQQSLRRSASAENIAAIDDEINRLEDMRSARELASHQPMAIGQITTFRQLNDEIAYYTNLLQTGDAATREFAQTQINALNDLKGKWESDLSKLTPAKTVNSSASTLGEITDNISILNAELENATVEEAALINKQIDSWEKKADAIRNAGSEMENYKERVTSAVSEIGASVASLGNALELPELNVAGTMAQAIATMVNAYAKATEGATVMGPFGWLAFAATGLAQLSAMVASVKQLPAFANGGIVSGPTVGLIGEYAGASNNPEVVAPLNKLQSLLEPRESMQGRVVFKLEGRTLVGVLENERKVRHRS